MWQLINLLLLCSILFAMNPEVSARKLGMLENNIFALKANEMKSVQTNGTNVYNCL